VPNARITELIAAKLRSGLTHPGDPERNIPSRPIVTPFGRTAGMPKEGRPDECVDEDVG
jgi:hypothetical protein